MIADTEVSTDLNMLQKIGKSPDRCSGADANIFHDDCFVMDEGTWIDNSCIFDKLVAALYGLLLFPVQACPTDCIELIRRRGGSHHDDQLPDQSLHRFNKRPGTQAADVIFLI